LDCCGFFAGVEGDFGEKAGIDDPAVGADRGPETVTAAFDDEGDFVGSGARDL